MAFPVCDSQVHLAAGNVISLVVATREMIVFHKYVNVPVRWPFFAFLLVVLVQGGQSFLTGAPGEF